MANADETVGIPWYRRRDYERILTMMSDRAQLPRSYERWRLRVEILEQRLRDTGKSSIRMTIDPKMFARWCSANKLRTNAHARLLYVEQSVATKRSPSASVEIPHN